MGQELLSLLDVVGEEPLEAEQADRDGDPHAQAPDAVVAIDGRVGEEAEAVVVDVGLLEVVLVGGALDQAGRLLGAAQSSRVVVAIDVLEGFDALDHVHLLGRTGSRHGAVGPEDELEEADEEDGDRELAPLRHLGGWGSIDTLVMRRDQMN